MKNTSLFFICLLSVLLMSVGCSDSTTGNNSDTLAGNDTSVPVTDTVGNDTAGVPDSAPLPDGVKPEDVPPAECQDCFPPNVCVQGQCVNAVQCTPGETAGCASETEVRECAEADGGATAYIAIACPPGNKCDDGKCLVNYCEPDKSYCEGLNATKKCNEDGTAFLPAEICPDDQYCSSGKCGSSCNVDPKFGAHVGCEFWTVDLPNYPDPTLSPTPEDLPYAVVVSNPNEMDAEVTFDSFASEPVVVADPVVPAGQSRVFMMPVINVSKTGISKSAIRLSSSRPVLVHQYNPWDNQFSNDASLLLPEPMLGSDYVILTWPTTPLDTINFPGFPDLDLDSQNGYFTVVAAHDNTTVTFQVTAPIKDGPGVTAMGAGGLQFVKLDRGEVLNVEADPEGMIGKMDLSGSTVTSDKPVAVFMGHEEAVVGKKVNGEAGSCCADHLEEQAIPLKILDKQVLAVKAKPRGSEPDVWRIQAAEPKVTINTVPPQAGADGITLQSRGDYVEVSTTESFEINATGKIQVGQYLVSQGGTESKTGDPSLILGIPTSKYRESYVIMVPPDYSQNWVTVIAKTGSSIEVDGVTIAAADYTPFGNGGWSYAYVALDEGIHAIAGDQPFGLVAYGFNNAVSYGYPGGLSD